MSDFQLLATQPVWKIGVDFEDQARNEGFRYIAGVDEVGRGSLAGPVVAAFSAYYSRIRPPDAPRPFSLGSQSYAV